MTMRSVCIPCRKAFKAQSQCCSDCGQDLRLAGSAFRAPGKRDDDGWKLVSIVLSAGELFDPGAWVPRTLAEVDAWRASRRRSQALRVQGRLHRMKHNRKSEKKRTTPKSTKRYMRYAQRAWKAFDVKEQP